MPSSRATGPGLQVHPFRALTYAVATPEQLARVSSPAYDLVTAAGRERLAAADPHNVVRLILPGVDDEEPGDDTGEIAGQIAAGTEDPATRSAARAARTLAAWRTAGVLVTDAALALWCYRMSGPDGEETVGWLGAVELPPVGSDAVLPHEDVYAPAVEGRRALLAATRTDLEPIVLAHDPAVDVAAVTAETLRRPVDLLVTDADGVRHELRRVDDSASLARLAAGFAQVAAVIADGHHRFAAARAHATDGQGRVLALLTPMGPGGLRVQAIHRVVPGLDLARAGQLAAGGFTVTPVEGDADEVARSWVRDPGSGCFLITDARHVLVLSSPDGAVRSRVPQEAPASWRGLDVVLAHHGLITGLWGLPDDPSAVRIAHDVPEALRLARDLDGVALLLRSSSPADVAAVARDGARMPRKSTLFVPKPRTGLVLRPH